MSEAALHQFFLGALTMAACTVALLFTRYWKMTSDRLFLFFSLAFAALAVNWLALAFSDPASENHYSVYLPRLAAFIFIIFAIVDKNRRS